MNEEIIKLNCLYCGAPLNVSANSPVVQCTYCGHDHLVPKLLEFYAQCPLCGRNDRVEKVTTATRNKELKNVLELMITDAFVEPPEGKEFEDQYRKAKNLQDWGVVIIVISITFLCGVITNYEDVCFVIVLVSLTAGIFLNNSGKKAIKSIKAAIDNAKREWELAVMIKTENHRNNLMPLYEQLYYCYRDDLIFLPGAADYTSPRNMERYLEKHLSYR